MTRDRSRVGLAKEAKGKIINEVVNQSAAKRAKTSSRDLTRFIAASHSNSAALSALQFSGFLLSRSLFSVTLFAENSVFANSQP